MKKMFILCAIFAMTTLTVQAYDGEAMTTTAAAVDTEAPTATDTDTNGTKEAAPTEEQK